MSQSTNWLSSTLVLSFMLVCCGRESKPTIKIDIAVTPSTVSIPFLSGVILHASGSSLVQGTTVDWVVEQDPSCTIESPLGNVEPSGPCTSGWLSVPTPAGNMPATTATYNAPQALGTYHVFAKERLQSGETGYGEATITLTLHAVDISITPTSATIPINSSLDLQAIGSSVTKYTSIRWYVDEEGYSCTAVSDPQQPRQAPSGPCPSGWVWQAETYQFAPSMLATYYSPSTPGTYRIVASATLGTGETGQSVATITVAP
jgi:hypothetical protein